MKSLVYALTLVMLSGWAAASSAREVVTEDGITASLEQIAGGLGVVWGMCFVGPRTIIYTERGGTVGLVDAASGKTTVVEGAPRVLATGQGGLLDVAAPPSYTPGDWLYFTYVKESGGQGVTTLARARLLDGMLRDWDDLVVTESATQTSKHFGSRIAFDGRGHVFFSLGDRGVRDNGQDTGNHAGAILRVNMDGTVPPDNPFAASDTALPEIWSYGHRNVQGLAYDRDNRRLWAIEHGPRGGDELNLIEAGANYGWPVVSHGYEYWGPIRVGEATEKAGYVSPVKVYIPSIAPGSLLLYEGEAFPRLRSSLFAGALAGRHINRIVLNGAGEPIAEHRWLEDLHERVRSLAAGPDGVLYFGTDSGAMYRLRPAE